MVVRSPPAVTDSLGPRLRLHARLAHAVPLTLPFFEHITGYELRHSERNTGPGSLARDPQGLPRA